MTTALACVLALVAAREPARDTAGRRNRGDAEAIASRLREPHQKHNSAMGRLDERAFRERAAQIAQELTADLRDPTLTARDKTDALAGLQDIGPLAAAVAPTLVAVLHDHDRDESTMTRVAYFCDVTKAMAKGAPRDPAVIRALADALDREPRGGGTCHRCACALEALIVSGPAAKTIAGPTLERLARQPSRVQFNRLEHARRRLTSSAPSPPWPRPGRAPARRSRRTAAVRAR